jgi:hypothetical protein
VTEISEYAPLVGNQLGEKTEIFDSCTKIYDEEQAIGKSATKTKRP